MISFDFVSRRNVWFSLSTLLVIASLGILLFNWIVKGSILNFGVEFTGGSVMVIRFEKKIGEGVSISTIRTILKEQALQESSIQQVGDFDISIRTPEMDVDTRSTILTALRKTIGPVELLEVDTIGPLIGGELRQQALWGLFWSSLLIMGYIAVRFEFLYSIAGLLALYHDAIIATGAIALLGLEVDMAFIAAILTIMGFSINDTIIIFDRIRENVHKLDPRKYSFSQIVNLSVNQTLPRSINTVLTVLFMNLMLIVFGGATIKIFALTLFIGFSVGSYSSIFLAAPFVVSLKRAK